MATVILKLGESCGQCGYQRSGLYAGHINVLQHSTLYVIHGHSQLYPELFFLPPHVSYGLCGLPSQLLAEV
jgi:hypothetical protein